MRKIFLLLLCAILIFPVIAVSSNEQAISEQIMILKSRAEHKEKWQAKDQLVKAGKEAVQLLIDALKDENAKYYAIRALGEIKDERAVEPLANILLDKNYGPRRYAAIALGSIKNSKAIPALQQAFNDEKEYVIEDALTALQYIDPTQGDAYLKKIVTQQNPNGLETRLSVSRIGNDITLNITFKNISSSDHYMHWSEIYQAANLIVQDETGRFIRPLSTTEYGYMTSESDFHLVRANEIFSVSIKGKVKTAPPAIISRSSVEIDWWNILYPQGPFETIDFKDTELDIGLLKGKTLKFYFVYEQGETVRYWGNKFGFKEVWTGKVVAGPVTVELK